MSGFLSNLFRRVSGKPRHFLAIDIGSNTAIRSLLLECRDLECAAIDQKSFEVSQPRRDDGAAGVIPYLEQRLRRLIFETIRKLGHVPHRTVIGIGSHFTWNEMLTARHVRPRPLRAVSVSEFEMLTRETSEANRNRMIGGERHALANLMPLRATVDGYPIEAPGPHTVGRNIEITFFASYAIEAYWKALLRLRALWGGLELEFVSNQAVIAKALVECCQAEDALIIKIGGPMTEVSLLSNGLIVAAGQFPVGGDIFTRALAQRLKIPPREAEIMKRQWGTIELTQAVAVSANAALTETAERWIAALVQYLQSEERFLLPERVCLIGGGARLGAIRDLLSTRHWYGDLTFLEHLDVSVLSARELAGTIFRNTGRTLDGPENVALAALAHHILQRV